MEAPSPIRLASRPPLLRPVTSPSTDAMAAEMAKAAQYVEALLPPRIGRKSHAVRADWTFIPSAMLGGDSFGYQWLDDEHFIFYLLDVSGHGVGPALHSVSILNVLRMQALRVCDYRSPSAVLEALNETFRMKDFNDLFFTIWYGVYNRRTRILRYSSGGHPPALLRTGRPGDYDIEHHRSGGILIGAVAGAAFASRSIRVAPGSVLYVFSDGAFEVPTGRGMMGLTEFQKIVAELSDENKDSPREIAARIAEIQTCSACLDDFALLRLEFP